MPWLGGTPWRPETEIVTEDLLDGRFEVEPTRAVWFEEIAVRRVDFSGARFGDRSGEGGLTVSGCRFEDCDFTNAVFHVAALGWGSQTVYRRCSFQAAKLRQVLGRSPLMMAFTLGDARFEECSFRDATIRGWLAHEAEFVDCGFRGKIDRCRFFGRRVDRPWFGRRKNEYRGNDFREVEFVWSSFEDGIPIGAQLWPESDAYIRLRRVGDRVRAVRPLVAGWPEVERREAEVMLQMLREDANGGQDEIFARRIEPDLAPDVADVHERVWSLLEEAVGYRRSRIPFRSPARIASIRRSSSSGGSCSACR